MSGQGAQQGLKRHLGDWIGVLKFHAVVCLLENDSCSDSVDSCDLQRTGNLIFIYVHICIQEMAMDCNN